MLPSERLPEQLAQIVSRIDAVRRSAASADELVALLDENAPVYAGLGANQVEQLRGCLLAALAEVPLPPAAMPYVIEELALGRTPATVAGAARAVRSAETIPPNLPQLLLDAVDRFRPADDVVVLDSLSLQTAPGATTTVLVELVRTLGALGSRANCALDRLTAWRDHPHAFSGQVRREITLAVEAIAGSAETPSCCHRMTLEDVPRTGGTRRLPRKVWSLTVEDQDGEILTLGEALIGCPSAIAFFYTRCMNPEKCSLTITKLARLRRRLRDEHIHDRVNLLGITYDPAFDTPIRLKNYGADRGLSFGRHSRLVRTVGDFEPIREAFGLGVSFGPVTVNRHRLDFAILDAAGEILASYSRTPSEEDEVFDRLSQSSRALVNPEGRV